MYMVWIVFIALFLMLIAWLLFAPVRLYINTGQKKYQLTYGPILGVYLIPEGMITEWRVLIKVLLFSFSFRID